MSKFKQRRVEWYIFDVSLKWRKQNWLKYFFQPIRKRVTTKFKGQRHNHTQKWPTSFIVSVIKFLQNFFLLRQSVSHLLLNYRADKTRVLNMHILNIWDWKYSVRRNSRPTPPNRCIFKPHKFLTCSYL